MAPEETSLQYEDSTDTNELGDELERIINDEISEDVGLEEIEITNTPNLYRGEALNRQELYELSACKNINLIYVAGSVHSGKTTLLTMMHHMFIAGEYGNIGFAGSLTLLGYKKRVAGLLIANGNSTPQVERTSRLDPDVFLHLSLVDKSRVRQELIFTDLSGELVGGIESYEDTEYNVFEGFNDLRNVIIVIDGELLCGVKRFATQNEGINTFTRLYEKGVIGKNTFVHVVISKYDRIIKAEAQESILANIAKYKEKFKKQMISTCKNIEFYDVASISQTEGINNYYGIENILVGCMQYQEEGVQMVDDIFAVRANRGLVERSFDKFAWKG